MKKNRKTRSELSSKNSFGQIEKLENRVMLTVDLFGVPNWLEQGPRPLISAQVDVPPDDAATGAVQSIAVSPTDSTQIYLGTVNGGVWRGQNVDPANPDNVTWTPLTDELPSLAIGSVAFSPLDPSGETLYVGTGSFSSLSSSGGLAAGVYRTSDAGETWDVFNLPVGTQPRIRTILPTAIDLDPGAGVEQVVLAGAIDGTGMYRSDDNGETWSFIGGLNGLPSANISDLIVDPNDSLRFYAAVSNMGVYRGDFDMTGGSLDWTQVNTGMSGVAAAGNIQIAAHDGGSDTVLFSLLSGQDGASNPNPSAYRSTDDGDNWNPLAAPPDMFERNVIARAANTMEADPTDDTVVYITTYGGGDDIWRYDASGAGSWVLIDNSGAQNNTAPHVDGRDLAFLGTDVLLDANDGGFYFLNNPLDATNNEWQDFIGDPTNGTALGDVEVHNIAWDNLFDVAVVGMQDNGTAVQDGIGNLTYDHFNGGDGGDVNIDTVTRAGAGESVRYISIQNLGGFKRVVFDSATNITETENLIPAAGLPGFVGQFINPVQISVLDPAAGESKRIVIGGGTDSDGPDDIPGNADDIPNGAVYMATNAATAATASVDWAQILVDGGSPGLGAVTTMALGGRLFGADNQDVLYVGDNNGRVYVRSTAGGNLTAATTPAGSGGIRDIFLDPDDWQHVFVTRDNRVFESINSGTDWTEITGGLADPQLRSLEFLSVGGGVLFASGNDAVHRMRLDEPGMWTGFGNGLPNALGLDLDYDVIDDVFLVGTFGRGAWMVADASDFAAATAVLIIDGDTDFAGQDDVIELSLDDTIANLMHVVINGVEEGAFAVDSIEQINVNGLGGNDQLIVDSSNGLINVNNGIRYDGGNGFDSLSLAQTGGSQTSETLVVGATNGSGTDTIVGATGTQVVQFENLEPIITNVAATDLFINGGTIGSLLNTDNAINYTDSNLFGPTWGLVTIDAFEPIHFINKTNVNLDAESGSDIISLNNVFLPTGLTNFIVDGSADANDRLEVIGSALADTFTMTAGNANYNNAGFANPLDIGFSAIESMLVAGRNQNDLFLIQAVTVPTYFSGNAGDDTFNISSNALPNAGDLNGITSPVTVNGGTGANSLILGDFDDANGNPNVVVTSNSISGMAPVTVDFASTGGTTDVTLHGSDSVANGDVFTVSTFRALDTLTINGNSGDDQFFLRSGARGDTTLNGGTDRDQFFVEMVGGGDRQVTVTGGSNTNDNLRVIGTGGNNTFVVTNGNVELGAEDVVFDTVETLQIDGGNGMDTFNVQSTNIDTFLNGDEDNDVFNFSSLAPVLVGGDLDGITGTVTLNGGRDVNTLNASDHGGLPNANVNVTSSQIVNFAAATINYFATNGVINVNLFGSDNGGDNFDVFSFDADNLLLIEGNAGNDTFNVFAAVEGDVTLKGETGVDNFLVELAGGSSDRQVNVIGGSGNDRLDVIGSSADEAIDVSADNISSGDEDVNYDTIGRLVVNALLGNDTLNVYSTGAPLTTVIGHVGNDNIFINNTTGATNRMIVNAGGGRDYVLVTNTAVGTKLVINGQFGNDQVDVGSSDAQDNGNLNNIAGRIIMRGHAGNDLLNINDRGAVGEYDYRVTPNWVVNNPNGIARPDFAGIQYSGPDVENLRLAGTDQRNEFEVTPSFDTHIFIDGNLPTREQIAAASEGDFLNLVTTPGDGHQLTLTDRDTGTGFWTFTDGSQTINFTEIEFFNHVERLAVGIDVAENPTLKVYDAESRNHLFTVQAYEPLFRGGVRVATGDINGDGIPDIIAAPGPGRAPTVRVFDGWDGTLVTEFDAYEPFLFDGMFVAAGQVTGDAAIDIVTTPGPGRQLQEVRVFRNSNNGTNMTLVDNYLPYESTFSGGASVAVADINGDGFADVITGRLIGKAEVAVFDSAAGNGAELARFRAIDDAFRGGVHVAAANYLGDATPDVIVSTGYNIYGSQFDSQVFVFDGSNLQFSLFATVPADFQFQAFFDPDHPEASLRLVGKDHDLDGNMDELFAAQGRHGTSLRVKVFQPLSATVTDTIFLADTPDFDEGFFLG